MGIIKLKSICISVLNFWNEFGISEIKKKKQQIRNTCVSKYATTHSRVKPMVSNSGSPFIIN